MDTPSPADSADLPQRRRPPSGELPPVEPPTIGFILQLFVIPMVIVTIIVVIWLLFNWLAHMGTNPTELVRDLKKLNDASWQKALTLADLLRNPQNANLKQDRALAQEVAEVLDDQIQAARLDKNAVQLRVFLCRALGEFQVPEVLPTLLRAASTQRGDDTEFQVRRAAVQALAIYISNNDSLQLQQNAELTRVLLDASRERAESDPENARAELRSTAAFALGMLGGDAALDRLPIMLDDAYANVRYNAAVALCRQGDVRALKGLLEMIDPDSDESVRTETKEEGKPWKRLLVMQNGLRAAGQLVAKKPAGDLEPLVAALERIKKSELKKFEAGTRRGIHILADEVLIQLRTP